MAARRLAPSEVAEWGWTALLCPALGWPTGCALCALGWQDVFAVLAPARETQSSVFLEREVDSSEPRGAYLTKSEAPTPVLDWSILIIFPEMLPTHLDCWPVKTKGGHLHADEAFLGMYM